MTGNSVLKVLTTDCNPYLSTHYDPFKSFRHGHPISGATVLTYPQDFLLPSRLRFSMSPRVIFVPINTSQWPNNGCEKLDFMPNGYEYII
jgi:hypothetical protein